MENKLSMFIGTNGHHIITQAKEGLFGDPKIRLTARALGSIPVDLSPDTAKELGEHLIKWAEEVE